MRPTIKLDPPPMPEVDVALVYLPDATAALQRAAQAWNVEQLAEHLACAERFIALVRSTAGIDGAQGA